MISFDDSVTATALPPTQEVGVFYADGTFANHTAVSQRLPKAKLYGITVSPSFGVSLEYQICDCEKGDFTVPSAEQWVIDMIALDAPLIIVYADLSTWTDLGLFAALDKYGDRIKRWVAEYDNSPNIPIGYDAKQYEGNVSSGFGNVDKNIANDDFFTPWVAPAPPVKLVGNKGTAHVLVSVDVETGHCTRLRALPGTAKYGNEEKLRLSWELQLEVGKGAPYHSWRAERLAHNAAPLGS